MIKAIKIRLLPTKEQEVLMFKSCGIARFTFNWGLDRWKELYKQELKPLKAKIRKEFNNTIKKQEDFKWLYEVSGQVTAQAFDDLNTAYTNFFNGKANEPKFKTKKNQKNLFMLDMMLSNSKIIKLIWRR